MERAEAEAIYDSGRESCVDFVLELARRSQQLAAECERLEERVRRLEEQARSDSRNSSKPPSSDPPKSRQQRRAEAREKAKELLRAEREQRKAGGQPGHRGSGRKLTPSDQVAEIVDHYPKRCRGCGRHVSEDERRPSRRFGRHQVSDLPPIAVITSEHRTHRLRCPRCRAKTKAELPVELRGSAFGARLQAAVVTMSARNRISRRDMSELARDLFGLEMSVGTVDAICQRAAAALAEPHERLSASVLGSPALNVDETGWRTAGDARALWTATTPEAALFRVATDRHRDRLAELIGEDFSGIVCSDRWWAYDHLDPELRQACWEHLRRDFTRHAEGLAEQKAFGEAGLELTGRLFGAWQAFEEHSDRRRLRREMKPIRAELRALLERAARKEHAHPPPPRIREQAAEDLAGALDLRHRSGRADQQRRRALTQGPGHPPQALPRHPQRQRRAVHRARPVGLGHLPPAGPLAVRLPGRPTRRPCPRAPPARTRLSQATERLLILRSGPDGSRLPKRWIEA
jgi:transposase